MTTTPSSTTPSSPTPPSATLPSSATPSAAAPSAATTPVPAPPAADSAQELARVTEVILAAKQQAYAETSAEPEPELASAPQWPVTCTVGPGLEGAIACETKIGYVNGTKGWLVYRGYDIFDLCAYSSFEETSYLLLHGRLPTKQELDQFCGSLRQRMFLPKTHRTLLGFQVEQMNPMAALRLGTNLMRQNQTFRDKNEAHAEFDSIASDDDSFAMEGAQAGETNPVFSFVKRLFNRPGDVAPDLTSAEEMDSCYNLIGGVASVAAAIARVRAGRIPLEPAADLSFAGNFLYMLNGQRPTALQTRIMDVCPILHADHGMNASTFAAMVVASTLSDIYFAVGSGIAALNGPLHGGANVDVVNMLKEIGSPKRVRPWYRQAVADKKKVPGFGHRVYKAYDPRARILGPLAAMLAQAKPETTTLFETAAELETTVIEHLGVQKKVFPNVDYFSGIVYQTLGIPSELYTTIFAVARVAGWCARVMEYLQNNRIFRPRAVYTGQLDNKYPPIDQRG